MAYYIAAVNIENAYHDATPDPDDGIGKEKYTPFDGIVLTDTFQLGETDENQKLFSEMFPQNSERVAKQKKAPLRVIMGNPPYSRGQEDANDNAQNQNYPKLESRISETYAVGSNATLSRDLYNSYIKAFRWSSDRLKNKEGGIIAFITGSGWIDKGGYTGFRKSLEKEFSSIYVVNLRGDIRGKAKETAKREGQNVFDIMTGVSITILVKKPNTSPKAKIHFYNLDDYMNRVEKLKFLKDSKSCNNIDFTNISPNDKGDWINQRTDVFESLIPLDPNKNFDPKSKSIFLMNGVGSASAREPWVYNFSKNSLAENMQATISFYNIQRKTYQSQKDKKVEDIVDAYPEKISWSRSLRKDISNNIEHKFEINEIILGQYRPFTTVPLYYHKPFIESPGLGKQVFPNSKIENLLITLPGKGNRKDFVSLMTKYLPDYNNYDGGCKYFPLYYYEERKKNSPTLFDAAGENEFIRRDGVSDFILERAKKQYGKNVGKEDIFYYVYGILHSPDYRAAFSNDLKKMLPRIPLVDDVRDFWKFSKAGRQLAELHINYENVPAYDGVEVTGANTEFYRVEKMRFPKKDQKDKIIFNSKILISNIPEKAYEYVVNGKSAIEWIMERYQITTHKDSGIKNDPNDWAAEVGNPRYILDLLLSIINVSVQTVDIVNSLPKLEFESDDYHRNI